MATRRDQLDAFDFARRRMVANLVVPTATGSDEGAPRPVRTFATSIVLSAVAVAAVAVLGVFRPAAPAGWQNGLAVDSASGAAYIDQHDQLHAIYNITSARLVLGTGFQKFDVPDSALNGSGIPVGSPVGILGAPEDVPSASNMGLRQWSLCQNEKSTANEAAPGGRTYLEIGYAQASSPTGLWTSTSDDALIVHDSAGNVFLIDGDFKYPVGNDETDRRSVQALLNALSRNTDSFVGGDVTGYWVSDAWLSAFAPGGAIAYPSLSGLGRQPLAPHQIGAIGQYGMIGSAGYVQTGSGVVKLSSFAYDLYISNPALTEAGVTAFATGQLTSSSVAEAGSAPGPGDVFGSGGYGANWPQSAPVLHGSDTADTGAANVCVGYGGTSNGGAAALTTWLSPNLPYGTPGGDFGLSHPGSTQYANVVVVRAGYGLIAQGSNGGSTGSGPEYLIEDSGYRYALLSDTNSGTGTGSGTGSAGPAASATVQLGYRSVAPETVPDGLLDLIEAGVGLDPDKAGQAPGNG